ncbi:hypothetical protein NBRC3280_3088 [Acetobacter pasteurianus NBRC 3280]|uniref:Uncharacterized protein n=1 Tax=Acetobacter pasteurianus NBRC 3278 TaxID=1226660 RepID=A0A401X841_ACEPA|nr:hypothetical protein [Acetobacter pasteurianus]GCD64040.1 hypothetical protein NBRC3278_3133 [Acetobacter pasteurianus NBRC 3278]GCD70453.1 hypothetical protein NBRC3280_3088 [Acetobacter pasteurianus NBRC 3280]
MMTLTTCSAITLCEDEIDLVSKKLDPLDLPLDLLKPDDNFPSFHGGLNEIIPRNESKGSANYIRSVLRSFAHHAVTGVRPVVVVCSYPFSISEHRDILIEAKFNPGRMIIVRAENDQAAIDIAKKITLNEKVTFILCALKDKPNEGALNELANLALKQVKKIFLAR